MTLFSDIPQPKDLVGDEKAESALRVSLLSAQRALRDKKKSVVILVSGVNGAGSGEVIRSLGNWLDPRSVRTYAFSRRSQDERERPLFWRYWMSLPAHGEIAIYSHAWYTEAVRKYAKQKITKRNFSRMLGHIRQLESDLTSDGALVLKYWLHLSAAEQKARFEELSANPETSWRVSKEDEKSVKFHSAYEQAATAAIEKTDVENSPWQILRSVDPASCAWFIGRDIHRRLVTDREDGAARKQAIVTTVGGRYRDKLGNVDLSLRLSKSKYQKRLARYQARLAELHRRAKNNDVSTVVVFEGWDAAGKGGAIRRLTYAMDPRQYRVIRIAAPTDEELAHHYLWRFWRQIPRAGHTTIYDRSWYGRVLVERVEGFATAERWSQAYDEINDFEQALVEHGTLVVKFWLHISMEEQLQRFKHREETPHKKHKITAEDYRNREKWQEYELAANEMLVRTDTSWAPWQAVAANDKRFARVEVLEHLCDALEQLV